MQLDHLVGVEGGAGVGGVVVWDRDSSGGEVEGADAEFHEGDSPAEEPKLCQSTVQMCVGGWGVCVWTHPSKSPNVFFGSLHAP